MKIFVSDIHLGRGDGSDDFHRDDLFLKFLEYAEKKASELIILGDLYELWQSDLEDIYWAHPEVIRKLHSMKNVIHIFGNHDYLPFSKLVPEVYTSERVTALHGHQYDEFNRQANPLFGLTWPIGKVVTLLVGELERWIHPDIDTWLLKMKDRLGDFKVEAAKIQNRSQNRNDLDELAQTVKGLKSHNLGPISIFGHSHESEIVVIEEEGTKRIYANCGAWVDDAYPTYLELTDTRIRLCDGNDLDVIEEVRLDVIQGDQL